MGLSRIGWYLQRAARMSPAEVGWRARDQVLHKAWSTRQVKRWQDDAIPSGVAADRRPAVALPADARDLVPVAARKELLAVADRLMGGDWEVLGVHRDDLVAPDWFHDPVTGKRAPADQYAFSINHRREEHTGNIKQIWEISRLHHLTLLAAAWFVSRDDRYADRVADQLRSWWRSNPFLTGVHWTSGIEIGIRLISLAWIRRLLDDWPPVSELFERNDMALTQIRWHQQYLAAFRSRGSSANNHVIAEAAGLLVASCAFGWFAESPKWRHDAARLLERELIANTFPSGVNRELASDYQYFVAELVLVAAIEAQAAGYPLSDLVWQRLAATVDSGVAVLDETGRPPRQGDGDEGRVLLLDAPAANGVPSLIALAAATLGPLDWWPPVTADVRSSIVGSLWSTLPDGAHAIVARPAQRPWRFAGAGMAILRTAEDDSPEIWCRCDGGPHGFLSIAAHAHADALSVEVRYGGVDVLADPGTYCYHGEPAWRSYFRSTIAHNTVEIAGQSQSKEGGPFLWVRHADARELDVRDVGDAVEWTAEHAGYVALRPPAKHRRCVRLDRAARGIDIVDEIDGGQHEIRLAFHFGPEIEVELSRHNAMLTWSTALGSGSARIDLPESLDWNLHKGEQDRIMGWYSEGLGRRVPAFSLVGSGVSVADIPLCTRLQFVDTSKARSSGGGLLAVSWLTADAVWHSTR
ncbi:MAG TPA: alginate lyase family protein [Streptosporangiaceae bacterium]